jgi:hypothetical protein
VENWSLYFTEKGKKYGLSFYAFSVIDVGGQGIAVLENS